ncbi:MAG: alcohol dehydrogenase catalytic domain-containing protein [archaeon]
MKAAVYIGKGRIEIQDIPVPEIGDDEVLVRVRLVGLCKTDVKKVIDDMYTPPRVYGHEIVGEIHKTGPKVNGFFAGDRVLVFHHVPCLDCPYCKSRHYAQCETYREIDTTAGFGYPSGGGFSEYIRVPRLVAERGLIKIPDGVADEDAVFVEPLNCCLKAVRKAEIRKGDTVLIIGQGSIGLSLTQLCKLCGAKVITTDLLDFKLQLSTKFGADLTLHTNDEKSIEKIIRFNATLPNKCLVAVESVQAIQFGLSAVASGGRVMFVFDKIGDNRLCIDPNIISNKEIEIMGSYSSDYSLHQESAQLIFEGKVNTKDMITHSFKLANLAKAVEMAIHAEESIKILIRV